MKLLDETCTHVLVDDDGDLRGVREYDCMFRSWPQRPKVGELSICFPVHLAEHLFFIFYFLVDTVVDSFRLLDASGFWLV